MIQKSTNNQISHPTLTSTLTTLTEMTLVRQPYISPYHHPDAVRARATQVATFMTSCKPFVPGKQWLRAKRVSWSTEPTVEGRIYYTDGNLKKQLYPIKAKNPKEAAPFAFPADYTVVQEPAPVVCVEEEHTGMAALAALREMYDEDLLKIKENEDLLKIKEMARTCSEQRPLPVCQDYALHSMLEHEGLLSDDEIEDELYD